jgi:YgiT-type zinc finger domain-containing protein
MATLEEKLAGLQCPRCGRENTYVPREIEYTAKVGGNTVTVTIRAGVCTVCGEQLLDTTATDKVADAVRKLQQGRISDLIHMGEAYRYP